MRAVTSSTAAFALGIEPKQLDNLLTRIGPGAIGPSGRQGLARRIPIRALPELAVTVEVITQLGVGAREAYGLAVRLCAAAAGDEPVVLLGALRLAVDVAAVTARVDQRLAAAIEAEVRPRRGRPPRRG